MRIFNLLRLLVFSSLVISTTFADDRCRGRGQDYDGRSERSDDRRHGRADRHHDDDDRFERRRRGHDRGRRQGDFFSNLDRNGDGFISRDEWRNGSGAFTRRDRNRDGILSRLELLR